MDESRIEWVFRSLLARGPGDAEQAVLTNSLARLRREFGADPQSAAALLVVGEAPRDESLDPVEHAAWAALCNALFNLDETLVRE
jgi:hypothetical protein